MKVDRIRYYTERYKHEIKLQNELPCDFLYETVMSWKLNWKHTDLSLSERYDQSLSNSISGRLWGGNHHSSKTIMIQLMSKSEDMMDIAFRDLLNHQHDLALRLGRFFDYCDEAVDRMGDKINHHGQDKALLSLYLYLEHNQDYCLYDYDGFHRMMTRLEALDIPSEHETERYFKMMRAVFKLISKDEEMKTSFMTGGRPWDMLFMNQFMAYVIADES